MLTLSVIKENPEDVIRRLAIKHFDGREAITRVLELDKIRRASQAELDGKLAELKGLAAQTGQLMKAGKKEEAEAVKAQTAAIKESTKTLEESMVSAEKEITDILLTVPNLPYAGVPEGRTAADNIVEKTGGVMPNLPEDALPHWELAKKYDLIDFELGVKITGAGFPVYKGKGARLQRALISFFLDAAREAGYLEIQPPYVVNAASGYGTGQLPDKEGQMYHCNEDDLYLIPTAEVPVTNLYPRRDFQRERPPHQEYRLLGLLPSRSRFVRQRRARIEPSAPVRQGGDCANTTPRPLLRGSGRDEGPRAEPGRTP